jgi:putative nucleotidyltransferase with HDIG domain
MNEQAPSTPERGTPPKRGRRYRVSASLGAAKGLRLPLIYLGVFLALSLLLFPPVQKTRSVPFKEGDIADVDVVAPFSFVVPLGYHEIEMAKAKAAVDIPPVYVRNDAATVHLPGDLRAFFERVGQITTGSSASMNERVSLIKQYAPDLKREPVELFLDDGIRAKMMRESLRLQSVCLDRGILNDATPLRRRDYTRIIVISQDEETFVPTASLIDQAQLASLITAEGARLFPGNEKAVRLFNAVVRSHLLPNLVYDADGTRERREEAMRKVERSFTIAKDDRIIAKHDKVTRSQISILEAMEEKRVQMELATSYGKRLWLFFGKGVRVLSLLLLLGLALRRFQPRIINEPDRLTLAFLVLSIYLVLTALVMRIPALDPHLIPVAFVSLMMTACFGIQTAVIFTIFASLVIVTHTNLPASYGFISILAGTAAIISIAHLRERRSFYTIFVYVSAAYVIGIAGFGITEGISLRAFLEDSALGVANSLACTIVVMFLLPIFESLFDVTTNFTLMELSDLNRPLLRRLILEAPGTYHHSLMVGNLVEAVAGEVGANGLQARVGAYYHDIGKLTKPEYFFENKGENVNKHEKLAPSMSALILGSHVKDGIELARREKLPGIVIDAIREHHGTTVMAFFYQKALEYDSRDSVNIDDFRYPGPRPRSKENALIMLADSAEAAVRSLKDPTAPRIRAIVQRIFEARLNDGELDDCRLTLSDIAVIREKFIQLLTGIFHARVPYPSQEAIESPERGDARADHYR